MKSFTCLPDSHNAFGSLTNGVLTYFTVDCARFRRIAAYGISGAAEPDAAASSSSFPTSSTHPRGGASTSSSASMGAATVTGTVAGPAHQQDVQFTSDTRMHIQCTLILPSPFQATQCCFSMANRTVFGTDLAFIGAANGLLALAVLQEDLLLYVRGKDPQSIREQLQRGAADAPASATTAATPNAAGLLRSASVASSTTSDGVGNGPWLQSSMLTSPINSAPPHPSHSSTSGPPFFAAGSPGASGMPAVASDGSLSAASALSKSRPAFRRDAPSTITWMRDKPLVLVGYTSGRVEWYEVSISAARQQELLDPAKEVPYGAPVTPGAFAYQALNRDANTSRVARVVTGGQRGGLRTELVAACTLPEAGALVSSDHFPFNGAVAVVGEHGFLYLFDTDQPEAPLCEVRLSTGTASFLYCHPFLPLVGVLAQSVWADAPPPPPPSPPPQESSGNGGAGGPLPAAGTAVAATASAGRGWRRDHSPSRTFGHGRRSVSAAAGTAATFSASHVAARGDAAGPLSEAAARPTRHVGWHDDAPAAASGFFPTGSGAARVGGGTGGGGVHTGCVLMVVEYRKEPPPRQLARAWTGAMPPPPSHRLTQVLYHRMEGVAPRYGTYYNFSWKFSFELELVVANLEEGALRVVRAARGSSHSGSSGGPGTVSVAAGSDRDDVPGGAVGGGERALPELDASGGATTAGPPEGYRVVQDYTVRLPLHSLVNVEYVSAATSALSSQSAPPQSSATGGAAGSGGGELSAFQQEALRYQRQTLLLGAAAAAVDRRARLGFSAGLSLHRVGGGMVGVGGGLCHPAHPLWAGLAVVSMPQRSSAYDGSRSGAGGLAGGHGIGSDPHRLQHRHRRSGSDGGDVLGSFVALYDPAAGGVSGGALLSGTAVAADGGRSGNASGGPQLKEKALAAAMLQPFRGDTGAVVLGVSSSGGGGGLGRHRRRTGSASHNSSVPGGTDASSSNWLSSSTTTTSVSTQQPSARQRRRRGGGAATMSQAARRRRDPSASAVVVPSYAVKSTQNEIANAVLIAADQRVDLHHMLRIGPGSVSCVVGMNAAGEVASVPIEVRAVAAWHEEGSVFVGLGPTLCAADLVSIQGIERLMRRRHAAGFGLSAVANLAALKKVGGYGSEDVHMIFAYIATLEAVSLVTTFGPVPSLMELLHRGATQAAPAAGAAGGGGGGGAAAAAAAAMTGFAAGSTPGEAGGTGRLTRRDGAAARLGPAWRAVMDGCVCHDDVRCLLVLHVLRWVPTPTSEATTGFAGGSAAAASPLSQLASVLPPPAPLTDSSTNAEIERAVAVEVTHRHLPTAAALLLRFAGRSPSYRAVATLLLRPAEAQAMVRDSDPRVCASFRASLSPWLLVVFHCLCEAAEADTAPLAAVPPRTALPPHLYRDAALPFWDRVALAIVMEAGGPAPAFHHVMRELLLPECNLMQALLLHHGIHLGTCAAMQDMVDCTGDFQLGACLFARVGVLTAAAVLALPFLLDAEVSAAAAAADSAGVVPASPAAHSTILGLVGSPELSVFPFGPPALGDAGFGGGVGDDDGEEGALREEGGSCSSPFSYLRSGRARRRSSSRPGGVAGDASATAAESLEDAVAHTARLVRNSALPPPDRLLGDAAAAAAELGQPAHAADPSGGVQRYAPGGGSALLLASPPFHGPTAGGLEAPYDSDDVDADVPWVWWAAAYRSFLEDEQAFVRRTTFDVECQQLRGRAHLVRDVADAAATASPARWGSSNGGGRYGKGSLMPLLCAPSCEADVAGRHRSSPVSGDLVSVSAARRAASGGGAGSTVAAGAGGSGSASARGLLTAPPTAGLYATAGELSRTASATYGAAGASTATNVADPLRQKLCVCGVQHTGTQLLRSLLSLSGTATTRCSVCLEPVQLGARDVATAFAWCSSCGHGGHAHHLRKWFRTHRRCPVDGCDCHCDEDSSLY